MNTPNIHLFSTSEHFYFYDVNKNDLVMIPCHVYEMLKQGSENNEAPEIKELKQQGYLRSDYVKTQEHPVTPYLEAYLENKLSQMILQVTQSCNLRCEYCIYSGAYQNRSHSQLQMSEETAKRAIDFFIAHSSDTNKLQLSFYGGEPLLRVDFIQMCIDYIRKKGAGKQVGFNLTTNGTLLTDSVADFVVRNKISVMFSLDGPENVHDYHRKFAKNNEGSFRVLKKNVERLRQRYPEYFSESVRFNTVLDQSKEFSCVDKYISGEEWLKDATFNSSTIASDYLSQAIETNPIFIAQQKYEYFKLLLSKLHRLDKSYISRLTAGRWDNLVRQMRSTVFHNGSGRLPEKAHHGGPCIPGVLRTFVTAEGKIFPCEKVSEKSELACIGDLASGFDVEKIESVLNVGKASEKQCQKCWAYRYCDVCIRAVDCLDHISNRLQKEACSRNQRNSDQMLKDYCVLVDLGFDIEEEEA